jgi:starch synthase
MSKKRVLIITQEMEPYTGLSEISEIANRLPLYLNDHQCEIRILMPRFGTINERRHRLHEVVRLSGMNIIVNDDDYPLIIKVASLPGSRIQVYFLDNDDFFKRKSVFSDDEGQPFEDNLDRAVFFCKGAIETVRKFGWAPDVVHCHGWMTSLIPTYLRTAYKNDPLFQTSKLIYSIYDTLEQQYSFDDFVAKASINNVSTEELLPFQEGEHTDFHKGCLNYVEGVIQVGAVSEHLGTALSETDKPVLANVDASDIGKEYLGFYQTIEAFEDVAG